MEEQKDKNEHACCSHEEKETADEKSCCSSEKSCCSSIKPKCCCHGGVLKSLIKLALIIAIFSIGFHMGARNNRYENEGNFEKNFGGRQMMNRNYIPANSPVVVPTPTPATNTSSTK